MKERPIIFSAEMVRAILDGRKTQARRVIKPQPDNKGAVMFTPARETWYVFPTESGVEHRAKCPHGQPGDQLWVRETWNGTEETGIAYRATNPELNGAPWRPSIYMPRWASRLTLEVTGVRVERVQDIEAQDVVKEGLSAYGGSLAGADAWRAAFAELWDSINSLRGYDWASNPWVWVVEFKRVTS